MCRMILMVLRFVRILLPVTNGISFFSGGEDRAIRHHDGLHLAFSLLISGCMDPRLTESLEDSAKSMAKLLIV